MRTKPLGAFVPAHAARERRWRGLVLARFGKGPLLVADLLLDAIAFTEDAIPRPDHRHADHVLTVPHASSAPFGQGLLLAHRLEIHSSAPETYRFHQVIARSQREALRLPQTSRAEPVLL